MRGHLRLAASAPQPPILIGHSFGGLIVQQLLDRGIGSASGDVRPHVSLVKEHASAFPAKTSSSGEIWLLVGTDSGFEGVTEIYYQQIDVELLPEL